MTTPDHLRAPLTRLLRPLAEGRTYAQAAGFALGVRVEGPGPAVLPGGWWRRAAAMVPDRPGWRAVGYALTLCFTGIAGFAVASIWAGGIAALTYPVWRWLWPVQAGSHGTLASPAWLAGISAAGLAVTVAGAWLVRAAARADGSWPCWRT